LAAIGNIHASSGENLFFNTSISSNQPNSKVASFDVASIAVGCYVSTRNGLAATAISCTLRCTGVKATSGDKVFHEPKFTVVGLLKLGVSVSKEPLQNNVFPSDFTGLESFGCEIDQSNLDAAAILRLRVASIAYDDFVHTVHFRKDT